MRGRLDPSRFRFHRVWNKVHAISNATAVLPVEDIAEIKAVLETDFSELLDAEDLFATTERSSEAPSAELVIEGTGYVKKETKVKLLAKIFDDYRRSNPKAETISYGEVKETLRRNYGIECRSIANYFVGMLDDYETVGGNRNKAIVLPKP